MNDLFSDKSKVYCKIQNILLGPNANINKIASDLESIKDLKDQKSVVDFLIREQVLYNLKSREIEKVKAYLKMSTELAKKDLSTAPLPFGLFSDVFNSLTIQSCESFFSFMEECVLKFKDTSIFASGRTQLLRICNDLLRRLSKSQNTVFCGRIQIFLSRLFPLDEKSGLNLMGHFNTENLTPFNDSPVELIDEVSIDLTEDSEEQIDLTENENNIPMKVSKDFYIKFWTLQDYFRNPAQCYEEQGYTTFSSCVEEVISFFSKFHVNLQSSLNEEMTPEWSSFSHADMTFTKYLTNEKLFDLQLMDINFRRCILMQLAVTFQYLLANVKFKTLEQVLSEEQKKWVENQQTELQKLMVAVSTNREPFFKIVKQVLDRELVKNNWKNEGCPSFVKKRVAKNADDDRAAEMKKPRFQEDEYGKRLISFGNNVELARLWNICPDNLGACRDPKRNFDPSLTDYFATARLEMDPQEKVDEEYQSINNEKWCWASLRLLSRKSQHFYTNWVTPGQSVKQYLTNIICEKLQPEEETRAPDEDAIQTTLSPKIDQTEESVQVISPHIDELAEMIGTRWRDVGEALQLTEEVLTQMEGQIKSQESESKIGNKMLINLWMEGKCSVIPVVANLITAFEEAGLDDLAAKIKSWCGE